VYQLKIEKAEYEDLKDTLEFIRGLPLMVLS
jgi:hypothetical protein